MLSATKPQVNLSLKTETKVLKTDLKMKKNLKVYIEPETNKKFVEAAAAYALGYIDVARFNFDDNLFGPLNEEQFKNIKINFEVEFKNIKNQDENSKTL